MFFQALIFVTWILHSYGYQSIADTFQLLKENKGFERNVPVFYRENVSSLTECFMKPAQLSHKICFVQIEPTERESLWRCSLFNSIGESSFKTAFRKETSIYIRTKNQCRCYTESKQKDCLEWYENGFKLDGLYNIEVNNITRSVYCDMTRDSGGWTVIQKRFDGTVSFDRTWDEYKEGFGEASGEYWLGNELIHQLTKDTTTEIRITGTRFDNSQKHIIARGFWIENESQKYKLHAGDRIYGNEYMFNNWKAHDLMSFSTRDADNDIAVYKDCADIHVGGWWYRQCQQINPNGPYSQTELLKVQRVGLLWYSYIGTSKSLKEFEISIKRYLDCL